VTCSWPIKKCCFEDIGTHPQRDKRKLKLLLKGANDAWSSWDFKKKNKVSFKKIPQIKGLLLSSDTRKKQNDF
jgi:hypothetical protein